VKKITVSWALLLFASLTISSQSLLAQSLSSGLGATKLDGLDKLTACQSKIFGHREHLIADRLDARLSMNTTLTPEERAIWVSEIQALRATTPTAAYKAPDDKNPQRYFLGLTDKEQQSINTMHQRYADEVNLDCEKKYGGMLRYSPDADQSGQARYEQQLKDKMTTPIDIATIPVTPIPSPYPKTLQQMHDERRAARQAQRQQMAQTETNCMDATKGLRLTILADKMQQKFDATKGLSPKERADFLADIKATRDAADKKLDYAPPVDPKNPNRAFMRLSQQEQMDVNTEYSKQLIATVQGCGAATRQSRAAAH
jgi:hypothetical protein